MIGGMMASPEVCCLVQVNGGPWHRRLVTLQGNSMHILSLESLSLVVEVRGEEVVGVKRVEEGLAMSLFVRMGEERRLVKVSMEGEGVEEVVRMTDTFKDSKVGSRKKLLVLVNPVGGRGRARQIWAQVEDALEHGGVETEVVVTTHAGHAREIVSQINVDNYGGVVTVSGDGGLHEVLNGLWSRGDWGDIRGTFPIGLVPGGSGHGVHNSLLYHQGEPFSHEIQVAALNLSRGNTMESDYMECQTGGGRRFVSIFGVAWGVIPECDLGSEFLRSLGPYRGYLLAVFRILVPRLHHGTVHYLPDLPDLPDQSTEDDMALPALNSPPPPSWRTIQGPFHNVYAIKQPWIDYSSFFCPEAKAAEGRVWLVVIRGSMGRAGLLRWALTPDTSGHLQPDHTLCVPIKAFRFTPSTPGPSCPMTADAEMLEGGLVQGRVARTTCRLMAK